MTTFSKIVGEYFTEEIDKYYLSKFIRNIQPARKGSFEK